MIKPSWKIRRSIIIGTLIFCAVIIARIVWTGADSPTAQVALYGSFGLTGTVIGSYVFGAVWDDSNVMEQGK